MKLMILDGNSIVNRAYYGIRMLTAPDGTPTNGIYGFLTILNKLLDEEKPDYLCVAFDLKAPTFRHIQYEAYKAQRKPMPEELAVQIPILKEALDALGVHRLELEGYEADDIIGTVSVLCERAGDDCVIVTGDKDSFQLITDHVTVKHVKSRLGRTETTDYTPQVFREEYGFDPKRIIDLKALMGDSSDNIPGVKGIGEKTAMSLVQSYGGIDSIYADVDALAVSAGVKEKLSSGKNDAMMSFSLATIVTDVPIELGAAECAYSGHFSNNACGVFKRLGFNSLIEKWGLCQPDAAFSPQFFPTLPHREILSADDLSALLEGMASAEFVSVLPVDDSLDALELCDGRADYTLRWANVGDGYNDFLRNLFSQQYRKVSHNNKDLMGQLLSENIRCGGFIFDTALAAYLIDPTESGYALPRISARYLGVEMDGAEAVSALYPVLRKKLEELGMTELMEKIELPLCLTLADMERAGFSVDRQALYEFGEQLSAVIDETQKEIYELSGEEFNINSPKQLGEVLFEKLMLPSGKKTKTGWSTNADVLEKLRGKHPIIDKVLTYRQYSKLKSTYCDGLLKVIASDGRIHTSFQMTVTATGRLSSTEPNLQNIPVRTPLGAEMRKMFVAGSGNVLVDADYSQIELRLLAHISGDKAMQEAFLSGQDFHTVTASQVFGVPLAEVTPMLRSRAKAVNFGIIYGISAFSLAQDIGVFQSEAKEYMDAYYAKYSGVRKYMDDIVEKANADGYVSTLFGRRRPMPELKAANRNIRNFGERVALNMPIQGTAADIIKLAMVNVHNALENEGLEGRLILQVHDELIVECPENEAERVKDLLVREMENVVHYDVPLTVDAHIGKSWAEAK